MPNYDFKCEKCGVVEEHNVPLNTGQEGWPRHCGELMDKQWANPSFAIKGKFRADNGYSNPVFEEGWKKGGE